MIYPVQGIQSFPVVETDGYVSFRLGDQWLGIPVIRVQEVLVAQRISPVPLAPPEVSGFLNLRGQIVTAVDLRIRLGLPPRDADSSGMNIVVRDNDELFSLVVDAVGDVVEANSETLDPTPRTLDRRWRDVSEGVIRMPTGLLVVLSVDELLHAVVGSQSGT
jgi:purine-binding chemotaxis protein CheW